MADKLNGTKAHTRYYTNDGKQVPGATTIVGLLNKPQLIVWANRLGLQGIDSTKYRDKAAEIGSCAHYLVQSYLERTTPDLSLYSKDTIDRAENALISFFEWEKQVGMIIPILLEKSLVSQIWKFGGTIDCYCELNDKKYLLDFKTGSGIYDEYAIQVSAYRALLEEHGYNVDRVMILNIGRTEDEAFLIKEFSLDVMDKNFEIFKNLLNVYYVQKSLKAEKAV